MFDWLRCEYPLPDKHMQDHRFQTKDTPAQFMFNYTITASGRLIFHRTKMLPPVDGWAEEVPVGDVDTGFHGAISFYDDDEDGNWHEYRARFVDGQVQEIILDYRGGSQ